MSANNIVIDYNDWNTSQIKYMAPKILDKGIATISIISTQTNRGLQITTPMMTTWGISDYVDVASGESNGKYSMSLNFPNPEYETPEAALFLEKFKAFENQIMDDAVKNCQVWWKGAPKSRELLEYGYFPSLKYSKNRETGLVDHSRPPSLRPKIPFFSNKWNIEIYDVHNTLLFPNEFADGRTPVDFVQKLSSVACVLQFGGIWISSKSWGLTIKCIQCVVKPRENIAVLGSGRCFVKLSAAETAAAASAPALTNDTVSATVEEDEDEAPAPAPAPKKVVVKKPAAVVAESVIVEDSDDESAAPVAPTPPTPAPVVELPPLEVPESLAPAAEEIAAAEPVAAAAAPIKKKTVIKKKV